MAKLKAPLMSLGASGALGEALVFFPWKGLNVVREYVVPANPKTTGQTTQRGYLTDMVTYIHMTQAHATHPLTETDIMAYALLASTRPTPRTWFNEVVKQGIDQYILGKKEFIFSSGLTVEQAAKLDVVGHFIWTPATKGYFHYGTSKTALLHSKLATIVGPKATVLIDGLTKGVKYFWQFRPTEPVSLLGARSGIYYGTPT